MPIQITSSDYIKTVEAEIDGYLYKVRKMGAGDSLDVSQVMDKMAKIRDESDKLQEELLIVACHLRNELGRFLYHRLLFFLVFSFTQLFLQFVR